MHTTAKKRAWHHHHGEIFHKITGFLKKNAVLCIAVFAALITCFIVPPDKAYLGYLDFKTLTCLFCVLAVVCALRNIRFFTVLARKIVQIFKTTRSSILALVYITFLGSMLIANDMALLTFLPLGYFVLSSTGKQKYMAFTFIMQNIAANLGGMLTPFGNPQNLYLYSFFEIPTGAFVLTMLPPFCISVFLITLCCLIFVKKEPLLIEDEPVRLPKARTAVYGVLFALSIVIVFHFIPYWIGLIVVPFALLFLDRNALKQVDYGLLFTFVAFFIFAGNMARIPAVERLLGGLIAKNPLVVSAASCQVISNVPSAILLSQFTSDWRGLLVGVNIGGTGTLISSLASLITFREYTSKTHGQTGKYILWFSLFNFGFLFTLTALEYFIFL
ncbi:MAG: citrate transporter [Clostridia bacterium]|nr:citrate transporter [Clostridia bacterium]MBQ7880027.1 citrate transporter [Clostridia bacterium]